MINLKELKDLIALMNENQLNELEIEKEGTKVRLKKAAGPEEGVIIQQVPMSASRASGMVPAGPVPVPDAPPKYNGTEIKSPMVGTFYRAPAPEAPPFVDIGQQIQVGQVLCILEAMKLMNEIKSEVKGKLVHILVDNGQPVEFGQVMFIVEPN